MRSPLSRGLTALLAVLFGVLGLILFLAPGAGAQRPGSCPQQRAGGAVLPRWRNPRT
ncbi:MAG: hypothetical protein ACR2GE_09935 [Pseudonocardia sp.]